MVTFHFNEVKFGLANRQRLKSFIASVFAKYRKRLESISYVFCTDEYLLQINKQYLKHNYYTDIITFDLSSSSRIVGEIYISVDRVRDNARKTDSTLTEELHRVIFHGALHLCGLKDKTEKEKSKMTKAEDECLKKYLFHVKQ